MFYETKLNMLSKIITIGSRTFIRKLLFVFLNSAQDMRASGLSTQDLILRFEKSTREKSLLVVRKKSGSHSLSIFVLQFPRCLSPQNTLYQYQCHMGQSCVIYVISGV
jgi:hypothetical protein